MRIEAVRPGREIALPASALADLRRVLQERAGPQAALEAMHAAGYSAGAPMHQALTRGFDSAEAMAGVRFWSLLERQMEARGWGSLAHRAAHPGIGLLVSSDWAEAEGLSTRQPVCAFSVGLLSRILTGVAGAPVSVLEATCRAAGQSSCTFAFGSAEAVEALYATLLRGRPLEAALREL